MHQPTFRSRSSLLCKQRCRNAWRLTDRRSTIGPPHGRSVWKHAENGNGCKLKQCDENCLRTQSITRRYICEMVWFFDVLGHVIRRAISRRLQGVNTACGEKIKNNVLVAQHQQYRILHPAWLTGIKVYYAKTVSAYGMRNACINPWSTKLSAQDVPGGIKKNAAVSVHLFRRIEN